MNTGKLLGAIATVVVFFVVFLLVAGQVLGQPILLGFVATGSMEPTMDAGDGFVSIPSVVAGSPSEGDVVVFEATELHDGGLTTHRVVEETEDGYITRGDANPFTDQDGGEPPVTEGQIVAVALQVNGHVITIPHLGTAIMGIQAGLERGFALLSAPLGITGEFDGDSAGAFMIAIGVGLLGFGFLLDQAGGTTREVDRTRSRKQLLSIWLLIGVSILVLVTFATAAMVIPSGGTAYGLVSTEAPTDDPQVVEPGETAELTRTIENSGYAPIVVALDAPASSVETEPSSLTVPSRSSAEATVSMTAPDQEGEYLRTVSEHRYIMVLPPSLLLWLHSIHPFVAIGAVNGLIVGIVVTAILFVFGSSDLRLRSGGDHVPFSRRLERKLRKWL